MHMDVHVLKSQGTLSCPWCVFLQTSWQGSIMLSKIPGCSLFLGFIKFWKQFLEKSYAIFKDFTRPHTTTSYTMIFKIHLLRMRNFLLKPHDSIWHSTLNLITDERRLVFRIWISFFIPTWQAKKFLSDLYNKKY